MDITVNANSVITLILMSIRIGAVFILSPLLSLTQLPVKIKVLLVLGLAAMVYGGVGDAIGTYEVPESFGQLFSAALSELFVGMVLAFGIFAVFAVFMFGGRILDFQMGFGVAGLIDPLTRAQNALLGTALTIMAVIVFFALDAHHYVLRGLVYSFERLPVGVSLTELNMAVVVSQFGVVFVYGLAIVSPAVLTLLLLDIGMAVAARTMPQVNIFIVGLPLKIAVGLLVLALSIKYMSATIESLFSGLFRYWEQVLG
ncbi:MAG: flagellar biosynthetic protein FliR [Gammaproteobacteria bacterium]|nr:flagellar biosynthetic protein FliR [Gammaproteobacteria bacterium]MDH5800638.1 flagellar biosynthetic protein FliR [Gammaproteobacteria bacterium]